MSQTLNPCKREFTSCELAPSIIFESEFQAQYISGATVLGLLGIYNAETRIRSSARSYVSLIMRHGLRTSQRITAAFLGFYEWLHVSVVVWSIQIYKLSGMVEKRHPLGCCSCAPVIQINKWSGYCLILEDLSVCASPAPMGWYHFTWKSVTDLYVLWNRSSAVAVQIWQPHAVRARQQEVLEQQPINIGTRQRSLEMEISVCQARIKQFETSLVNYFVTTVSCICQTSQVSSLPL